MRTAGIFARRCWHNKDLPSFFKELLTDPFAILVPLALLAGTLVAGAGAQYYVAIKDLNRQIAARKAKEDLKP